ncbi:hypothetical protein ACINWC323_1252 [Acinetobacter sp. WC-323]|nr:hypothetical protein ACINWC323_1252 [Acinetobacter sp. WC-323]
MPDKYLTLNAKSNEAKSNEAKSNEAKKINLLYFIDFLIYLIMYFKY